MRKLKLQAFMSSDGFIAGLDMIRQLSNSRRLPKQMRKWSSTSIPRLGSDKQVVVGIN